MNREGVNNTIDWAEPEPNKMQFTLSSGSERNTRQKHVITADDTYSFDERGFQLRIIGTARVVTSSERFGMAVITELENRKGSVLS